VTFAFVLLLSAQQKLKISIYIQPLLYSWEGTTNVLAHDALRVLLPSPRALATTAATAAAAAPWLACRRIVDERVRITTNAAAAAAAIATSATATALPLPPHTIADVHAALRLLRDGVAAATAFVDAAVAAVTTAVAAGDLRLHTAVVATIIEPNARHLLFALSRVYTTSCLFAHAAATGDALDWHVAAAWTKATSTATASGAVSASVGESAGGGGGGLVPEPLIAAVASGGALHEPCDVKALVSAVAAAEARLSTTRAAALGAEAATLAAATAAMPSGRRRVVVASRL
jgi:hypothetical protein